MHYKDHQDRHQIMVLSYDSMISQDNPVRLLDVMCRNFVKSNQDIFSDKGKKKKGCKAYPPVPLLNLLVYGYFNGISTSRKLERESHRNIEVLWLMEGLQPDHWTISEFRKENGAAIKSFLNTFRKFLKDRSYISGERIVFDGSKVKAYASKEMLTQSGILKKLDNIEKTLSGYFKAMEQMDALEDQDEKLKREIEELQKSIDKKEAEKKKLKEELVVKAIKERKNIVEHPFGTIRALMGKFDLVLCGKTNATIELDLYTLAYSLKRLGNIQDPAVLVKQAKSYNWKAA